MVPVKSLRASNCTVARCPRRARILVAYGRLRFRGRMTNHPSKNPANTPAWSASITAHGAGSFPRSRRPTAPKTTAVSERVIRFTGSFPYPASAAGSTSVARSASISGTGSMSISGSISKSASASRSVPPPSAPPITPVTIFNTGTTNPPTIKQLNRVCRSTVSPPLLSTISNQRPAMLQFA